MVNYTVLSSLNENIAFTSWRPGTQIPSSLQIFYKVFCYECKTAVGKTVIWEEGLAIGWPLIIQSFSLIFLHIRNVLGPRPPSV